MKVSRRVRGIPAARWLFLAIILPSTILAGATWFAPALAAQEARTLSYGEPEEVGMSRAVLEGALGLYHEAVERGGIVGAVLLVARKGKIVLHEAVGMRDKERGLPMERNSMFRMASNTKPVVATAVAQLVEEGKLSYDDLVREYIPEWDNYRAGFITVEHLLSHSSGLRIPTLFLQPLGENPTVNSSWTDAGLMLSQRIHVGIAVAVPDGLVVPVIRDTDEMNLQGLARTVNDLAGRARRGELSPDEVRGGTFTVTNHGISGSLLGTPIINQPQAAILGVGKICKRAVVNSGGGSDGAPADPLLPSADDTISIRPMSYLSLAFDHRILDGFGADSFLADVVKRLENWGA